MTREEAEKHVDALFEDLRDRRFLKWLFNEHGADAGPIMHNSHGEPLMPLDIDVQDEIRRDWVKILLGEAVT